MKMMKKIQYLGIIGIGMLLSEGSVKGMKSWSSGYTNVIRVNLPPPNASLVETLMWQYRITMEQAEEVLHDVADRFIKESEKPRDKQLAPLFVCKEIEQYFNAQREHLINNALKPVIAKTEGWDEKKRADCLLGELAKCVHLFFPKGTVDCKVIGCVPEAGYFRITLSGCLRSERCDVLMDVYSGCGGVSGLKCRVFHEVQKRIGEAFMKNLNPSTVTSESYDILIGNVIKEIPLIFYPQTGCAMCSYEKLHVGNGEISVSARVKCVRAVYAFSFIFDFRNKIFRQLSIEKMPDIAVGDGQPKAAGKELIAKAFIGNLDKIKIETRHYGELLENAVLNAHLFFTNDPKKVFFNWQDVRVSVGGEAVLSGIATYFDKDYKVIKSYDVGIVFDYDKKVFKEAKIELRSNP